MHGAVVNENEFRMPVRQGNELDVYFAARRQIEGMRSPMHALQSNGLEPSRRRTAFDQRHLDSAERAPARVGDADPSQAEAARLLVRMFAHAVDDQPWAHVLRLFAVAAACGPKPDAHSQRGANPSRP